MWTNFLSFFETDATITDWLEILVIAASLFTVAFFVNRYLPSRRRRIRQSAILFIVFLVATLASSLLEGKVTTNWARFLSATREVAEAFTLINLATLTIFELLLPLLKFQMVSLSIDLFVGLAYAVSTLGIIEGVYGLTFEQMIGGLGLTTAILTFSQQETLANLFGGIALQFDKSLRVGDFIRLPDGEEGTVIQLGWRHTKVETTTWDTIIVPNRVLFTNSFLIAGKRKDAPTQRCLSVYFNVDFHYSPNLVIDAVQQALVGSPVPNVAIEPPPSTIVCDLAKAGLDSVGFYEVRFWIIDFTTAAATKSAVRSRIYAALRRENIPFARPTFFHATDDSDDNAKERELQKHREIASRVSLFDTLAPHELQLVVENMHHAPFIEGETIIKQGDISLFLYIMVEGTADIQLRVAGAAPKVFETIQAPSIFGEMGLLTGERRANDVIAKTNVECYTLSKLIFTKLIQARPQIVHELSTILAHRKLGLVATQETLDEEAVRNRAIVEKDSILKRIEYFFGLDSTNHPKNKF